ncbi:MAG TPA: LacI family transcriptional regulator [Phycisphaerales bacterium]|nr:LacI family transcriptional regulator [Phycisphaerales bacterium]
MSKRKINQKDIADSLRLSVATVSKALSGDYSDINTETRARVVNMASQLGYMHGSRRQQAIAEDTASYLVGVLILRKLHEWQHTTYFAGMSEKCAKLNVSLILHYVSEESCEHIFDQEHQPPAMREGKLSGLILVNHWPQGIAARLAARQPCVSIQQPYPQARIDLVGVDEVQGVDTLADHLYGLGHRRIGFFGHCPQVDFARRRFGAYVSALCRLGLDYNPAYTVPLSAAHLEDKEIILTGQIESVTRRIQHGVRAWICASDWVGYLLCRGLIDRGYSIPKDVSVVGFDDSEDNTLGCPKLTSISIPAQKIGAEALRRLINRMRHPASPVLRVMLPCKLFEAQTTGAPPRGL